MKNFTAYIVFVLTLICAGSAIIYKDCGSKDAKVKSVAVTGCASTDTCVLTKGKNATIAVDFLTSNKGFSKATAVVHGIVAGLPVPFHIPQSNACSGCGLTCPVKQGTDNKYSTQIYIRDSYPSIEVVVKWELKDENSVDIICIEVPAKVG